VCRTAVLLHVDVDDGRRTATPHRAPRRYGRVDTSAHESRDARLCPVRQTAEAVEFVGVDVGFLSSDLNTEDVVGFVEVYRSADLSYDRRTRLAFDIDARERMRVFVSGAPRVDREATAPVLLTCESGDRLGDTL